MNAMMTEELLHRSKLKTVLQRLFEIPSMHSREEVEIRQSFRVIPTFAYMFV